MIVLTRHLVFSILIVTNEKNTTFLGRGSRKRFNRSSLQRCSKCNLNNARLLAENTALLNNTK